jgi:hypothetical protein
MHVLACSSAVSSKFGALSATHGDTETIRLGAVLSRIGGFVLTMHALYGFVVHRLALAGVFTWTQVQRLAGAPITPVSDETVRELITASMLIWNPWFLLGGVLFLAVAWYASRSEPGRVRLEIA